MVFNFVSLLGINISIKTKLYSWVIKFEVDVEAPNLIFDMFLYPSTFS